MPYIFTPWGQPDTVTNIAEGITHYTTSSHGGYKVSKALYAQMPAHLRQCSFTNDNWFEEDCSWCAVVLAFPQYFNKEHQAMAVDTYNMMYKEKAIL